MRKPYDFASQRERQKEFAYFSQRFLLHPKHLLKCNLPSHLCWRRVQFKKSTLDSVINQAGVYAFAIGLESAQMPPHSYVLYIGQTGAKRNDRTLRQRVKEYYLERTAGRRPHISEFLNKWKRCLIFHFAPLDPTTIDLLKVEKKLNDALMPPYSVQDFSPEIRRRKRIEELR